jgi:hypothetical protein
MATTTHEGRRTSRRQLLSALGVALLLAPALSRAADALPAGCSGFRWDLSRELALFGTPGSPVTSGTTAAGAPSIELDTLYAVTLVPQDKATLPHEPGKPRLADGARAALLRFQVAAPGRYRVTIDDGAWIDVVNGADLVTSNQFQGRSSCPLFHKSVEYTLPAATPLIVQISGSTSSIVRVAVTRVP